MSQNIVYFTIQITAKQLYRKLSIYNIQYI